MGLSAVVVDGKSLTIERVVAVARNHANVMLSDEALKRVEKCRKTVRKFVDEGKIVYGITTGFGPMISCVIPAEDAEVLQENLIRSHASGVGNPLPTEYVRAMMLVRANVLAMGHSGVRPEVLKLLIEMLNRKIHPVIPEIGSVGASGDLTQLAHMALTMMGEGFVEYRGKIVKAAEAMKNENLKPLKLSYKEGLALINGTSAMTGIAALVVYDLEMLIKNAAIAAALTIEAMRGFIDPFEDFIHNVRPHEGQREIARYIKTLLDGSKLVRRYEDFIKEVKGSVEKMEEKFQDVYSLRCTPQVLGASLDALKFVRSIVETELNSASDNPLIDADNEKVYHGGNFHGQHISMAMDFAAIAATEVGLLSERRLAILLNEMTTRGLPPFLVSSNPGLRCGFMGVQYVATSLVAENQGLACPISIKSIPTNAENQDVVSMGLVSARRTAQIISNTRYIIALEMIAATQGIELRGGKELLGSGTKIAYEEIRRHVSALEDDRSLSRDLEVVSNLIREGRIVQKIRQELGI